MFNIKINSKVFKFVYFHKFPYVFWYLFYVSSTDLLDIWSNADIAWDSFEI